MGAKQLSKCKTINCKFNVYGRCKVLRNTNFKKCCPFFSKKPIQDTTTDDLSEVTVKTDNLIVKIKSVLIALHSVSRKLTKKS